MAVRTVLGGLVSSLMHGLEGRGAEDTKTVPVIEPSFESMMQVTLNDRAMAGLGSPRQASR